VIFAGAALGGNLRLSSSSSSKNIGFFTVVDGTGKIGRGLF